jgi:hypothetical protein
VKITRDIVAEVLTEAQPFGHYHMGLCPYHNDHNPSLLVSDKRYYCYSCGEKGSLRKLYEDLTLGVGNVRHVTERKSRGSSIFPSDLLELDDFCFEAHNRLTGNSTYHKYLRDRNIDDCIKRFKLGYWDGWYTIPAYNNTHDVVGAVGRAGPVLEQHTKQRFTQPYGQRGFLYIPDWDLWENSDKVFVTFGPIDAISLAKLGFGAASPTSGKESTRGEWFDSIRKPIYAVPDLGERDTAFDLACKLGWRGEVYIPNYPEGTKDINEYLVHSEEELKNELGSI